MAHLNQLEKMLESGHRIITMESYEVDRVCDLLLELSRYSAKPYYLAHPEHPMYRLGASHIGIPKTNKPEDLMEHIEASQHYGIYILKNYTEILGDSDKVVFMISEYIKLPTQLAPYAVRSKHQMKDTG